MPVRDRTRGTRGLATMAPPKCLLCGKVDRTKLETDALKAVWAAQRGLCWDFLREEDGAPYWFFCVGCHRRVRGNVLMRLQ